MNNNSTTNSNPVGVLCDTDNLSAKILLLDDTISHMLAGTAEITDHEELVETVDLIRNLDDLRLQLINIQKTNQPSL